MVTPVLHSDLQCEETLLACGKASPAWEEEEELAL